ncbi:MAG TPA: hypothetical protein VFM82_11010 [Flavobacteriaceae bacterium]|nr:hypothetical protein [Flavobacteriaceae bacterium]
MSRIKFLVIGLLFVSFFTTTSCEKEDNIKDPVGNSDSNDTDNNNDDNNNNDNQNQSYPYISEVGLIIFEGDDPLSDDEPVYSFVNSMDVFLNPANSCQMGVKQYQDILEGDIAGAWGLELNTRNIDTVTDNSCFNEAFEITADELNSSTSNNWYVELFPPNGSPYKILYYEDEYVKLYREISSEKWEGSQGSIFVNPSSDFYTDANYGTLPKKVTFTFNNVRAGYFDENNVKKAVRIVGVIEITKQD